MSTNKLSAKDLQFDEAFVTRHAGEMTPRDLNDVLEKEDEIRKDFSGNEFLVPFADEAALMLALLKEYQEGKYVDVPFNVVAVAVFGFAYLIKPIDVIPDVIETIGFADDAAVFRICLSLVEPALVEYVASKEV